MTQISEWERIFENHLVDIAREYAKDSQRVIECLKFDSLHTLLNYSYKNLINKNSLEPIESAPKEDKERIWKIAKRLSPYERNRVFISRSIYLLEKLTK